MTERGESSHVREEVFRDIHTVWEEPSVVAEPVVAVEPVSPVVAEDGEDEPERDSDEDPVAEDDEVAEYADDMGTTASDIWEELASRNEELKDRVRQLEEENQTHQEMEEGYKAVAYQLAGDVTRLKAEIRALRDDLAYESAERARMENAWGRATRRVDSLEQEVRAKKARIDTIGYACWSAFGRAQDRVMRYPAQYDQPRHTIDRGLAAGIIDEEYQDSVRRGLLP